MVIAAAPLTVNVPIATASQANATVDDYMYNKPMYIYESTCLSSQQAPSAKLLTN